jgi:hypothetical protein
MPSDIAGRSGYFRHTALIASTLEMAALAKKTGCQALLVEVIFHPRDEAKQSSQSLEIRCVRHGARSRPIF